MTLTICVNEASTGPIRRPYLKEQRHCSSRINNRWSTHIMYVTSCVSNMSNAKNKTFLLIDCVKINLIQGFLGVSLMAYSHLPGPRLEQGPKTNGLYETLWRFHITPELERGPRPIDPHWSGPSPCFYLSPSSAQYEYTIKGRVDLPEFMRYFAHCRWQHWWWRRNDLSVDNGTTTRGQHAADAVRQRDIVRRDAARPCQSKHLLPVSTRIFLNFWS